VDGTGSGLCLVVLLVLNLRVLLPSTHNSPAAISIAVSQIKARPNGSSWNKFSCYNTDVNVLGRILCITPIARAMYLHFQN
jgi:hypothetical protein